MSVQIEIDSRSFRDVEKRFKLMSKHYPEETFKAIVKLLFDIKMLAQKRLKERKHIVTSRLRNSIFVKTRKQKFAQTGTNALSYNDNEGNTFNSDITTELQGQQGAVGTNVNYGSEVETKDSFLYWAYKNANLRKRINEIPREANKRVRR